VVFLGALVISQKVLFFHFLYVTIF
jgi:hypothetical protein